MINDAPYKTRPHNKDIPAALGGGKGSTSYTDTTNSTLKAPANGRRSRHGSPCYTGSSTAGSTPSSLSDDRILQRYLSSTLQALQEQHEREVMELQRRLEVTERHHKDEINALQDRQREESREMRAEIYAAWQFEREEWAAERRRMNAQIEALRNAEAEDLRAGQRAVADALVARQEDHQQRVEQTIDRVVNFLADRDAIEGFINRGSVSAHSNDYALIKNVTEGLVELYQLPATWEWYDTQWKAVLSGKTRVCRACLQVAGGPHDTGRDVALPVPSLLGVVHSSLCSLPALRELAIHDLPRITDILLDDEREEGRRCIYGFPALRGLHLYFSHYTMKDIEEVLCALPQLETLWVTITFCDSWMPHAYRETKAATAAFDHRVRFAQ